MRYAPTTGAKPHNYFSLQGDQKGRPLLPGRKADNYRAARRITTLIMEYVSNILFWISNGLLVPVVVGLLYFFIRSILMLGGFFNQYLRRTKQAGRLKQQLDAWDGAHLDALLPTIEASAERDFTEAVRRIAATPDSTHVDRILAEYEVRADADLSRCRMLTKFGPILGLMGTLIPMGPALAGLATGDVASMAYNMQIAFGAVGYVILQARQRWFVADLASLEFIAGMTAQVSPTNAPQS